MCKVSVIIPAYNAEKCIKEAICSAISQTYADLEVIVVDDGSNDKTRDIVEAEARRAEKIPIEYIRQENKGPGAARNAGIKVAKGEYVAFLDSDDIWMKEKIDKQIRKFQENQGYRLIHTGRVRLEPDGSEKVIRRAVPEDFIFEELLKENFICCSSVLVTRACFDNIGFFDEDRHNRAEDYDMWLRIARSHKIGFIDEPLVRYRVNPDGYNRLDIKMAYDSEKNVFFRAFESYGGDKRKFEKERLNNLMYRMGDSFFYKKKYKEAGFAFREALKYKITDIRSLKFYFISKFMSVARSA